MDACPSVWGGSTGITYSSRSGTYQRFGNAIYWQFFIILSSKGSSTGAATISGFPANALSAVTRTHGLIGEQANLTLTANYTFATVRSEAGTTVFDLVQTGPSPATATGALSNTNFANNTFILANGWYYTS